MVNGINLGIGNGIQRLLEVMRPRRNDHFLKSILSEFWPLAVLVSNCDDCRKKNL